jgi:hypothetical protein
MNLQKIQIKILRDGKENWVHFCYVPLDIKDKFDKIVNHDNRKSYSDWIINWVKLDYNIIIETWGDLDYAKMMIKKDYKKLYPEVFLDNPTDNQGWTRVWFTNHIKKELEKYG